MEEAQEITGPEASEPRDISGDESELPAATPDDAIATATFMASSVLAG